MKPGTYYIGDLCYVFTNEEWDEVCSLIIPEEGECLEGDFELKSGKKFSIFNTQHGDGTYDAYEQGSYIGQVAVDSGSIGCTLLENCKPDANIKRLGKVCEIEHEFWPSNNGVGLLRFGDVKIDTGDEDRWDSDENYEEGWGCMCGE